MSGSDIPSVKLRTSARWGACGSAVLLLYDHLRPMTFSTRILIGLGSGILLGLFLGEQARALAWAADGFVKLLQMTVLPYVTLSIIGSLGGLQLHQARLLAWRAGAVLVALWAIALVFALLIPLTFPEVENAAFFSTTLVEKPVPVDFVGLYIPANPFYSLANNIVPAVVLFSIVIGVALIGVPRKALVLDVLGVAAEALSRATRFIVRLTPYGLFAIAAVAAGTMSLEQLGRLQVYLVAYVGVSLLVSLWVFPGLVSALTEIRVRDILGRTRNALITAFVAGDLFIVLPVLIESSRDLLDRHGLVESHESALPDVIVPASFNFPHTGKLLSISFVLFAAWFADAALAPGDYPRLALTGLVTFFGSLNVAVPFLLDQFRIPADTFQLFLASGVINSRFGTLVAAVHTVTIALLGACAMSGALRWNRQRVVRYLATTVALTLAVLGGTRVVFSQVLTQTYTKDQVLAGMHLLRSPVQPAVRLSTPPASGSDEGFGLESIRSRGVLRVGHLPGSLPFAFVNEAGDLVGFDIDLAHRLASELGVRLEFVPLDRNDWAAELSSGACDVVMSGVAVTTERASRTLFTASYLDETVGLVVPDGMRARFSTWADLRRSGPVTVAVPDVPYYIAMLRELLPNATVRVFQDIEATMARPSPDVDAIALPVERGSAWTLLYPQYSVVVPEPAGIRVPLAYPLSGDDQGFARFMNIWIDLKRKDGTMDALYQYWILGRNAEAPRPRWSVIRDVLHWVD